MINLTEYEPNAKMRWYAVISHYHLMPQEVYSVIQGHTVEPLYADTPLEELRDISPLVIELKSGSDGLIKKLKPTNTLFFAADKSLDFDFVIDHLRNRMYLAFDGVRKGVFHYYQPKVASYFFSLSDKEDVCRWLSPLTAIVFFNQVSSQKNEWFGITQDLEEMKTSEIASEVWTLTPSQDSALDTQYYDSGISEWGFAQGVEYSNIDWSAQRRLSKYFDSIDVIPDNTINEVRDIIHSNSKIINNLNIENIETSSEKNDEKINKVKQALVRELYNG